MLKSDLGQVVEFALLDWIFYILHSICALQYLPGTLKFERSFEP